MSVQIDEATREEILGLLGEGLSAIYLWISMDVDLGLIRRICGQEGHIWQGRTRGQDDPRWMYAHWVECSRCGAVQEGSQVDGPDR